MAQVSIIVPAHNSAPFIGDCLESVLGQDFSDFELIVVDDGSSDTTPEVVRARCHGRIDYKLVQQPHSGPSCARNRGIRCSSGRYILFLDSDDSLAENALSVCVAQLELHALDALLFEGVVLENEGIPLRNRKFSAGRPPHLHGRIVNGETIFSESVLLDRYIDSAVMYMTRRETLAGHFFPEGQLYEDSVFTTRLLLSGRLQRAMCIATRLYRRRSRRGSITSSPLRLVNHASLVAVYESLTALAARVTEHRTRDCLHRYRWIFLREAIACSTRVDVPYSMRLGLAREILNDRDLPGRLRLCMRCLLASPEHPGRDSGRSRHQWADALTDTANAAHGRDALQQLFLYISTVAENLAVGPFKRRLAELVPAAEEVIMTIAEQLRAEGLKEGCKEGLEQTLAKLLALKFGPLPDALVSRINAADAKTLERWLERILTADSVESVLQS